MSITSEHMVSMLMASGDRVRSYSGRSMYGKRCVAIYVPDGQQPLRFGFKLAIQLAHDLVDEKNDAIEPIMNELAELDIRMDTLGQGTIVYFPELEWNDECTSLSGET